MEDPEWFRTPSMMKLFRIAVSLALIVCLPVCAQLLGAGQEGSVKSEYLKSKEDILKFEIAVNEVITSAFSLSPFAVVQKAKGAYLPGYGISLSFLINIHRAVITTPFGQARTGAVVTPETKHRRIEELKDKLIQVLHQNGTGFRQLRTGDSVTIIAFIEDRNFPGEPNANKTIVLSALKKDLDALRNGNDKEFRERVKIFEY